MKCEIHILKDRCKGCWICVELCQADVLQMSEGVNRNGYRFPSAARPEACIYCGLCEMLCPDFAIWVRMKEENVTL